MQPWTSSDPAEAASQQKQNGLVFVRELDLSSVKRSDSARRSLHRSEIVSRKQSPARIVEWWSESSYVGIEKGREYQNGKLKHDPWILEIQPKNLRFVREISHVQHVQRRLGFQVFNYQNGNRGHRFDCDPKPVKPISNRIWILRDFHFPPLFDSAFWWASPLLGF